MKKMYQKIIALFLACAVITVSGADTALLAKSGSIAANSGMDAVSEEPFGYSSEDRFVADALLGQATDENGNRLAFANFASKPVLADFVYKTLAEGFIDQKWLTGSAVFWKAAKDALEGDFVEVVSWKKLMYENLILDWLTYQFESDEFKSEYQKTAAKYGWKLTKQLAKKADIYSTQDLANMSVESAMEILDDDFYESMESLEGLSDVMEKVSDMAKVVDSGVEYYKRLTQVFAAVNAYHTRVEYLEQVKAVSTDQDLKDAIDSVTKKLEKSFGQNAACEGGYTVLKESCKLAWGVLVDEMKVVSAAASTALMAIELGRDGLNWLFNTDNASKAQIQLVILYIINADFTVAYQKIKTNYVNNPDDEKAGLLNDGFLSYVSYQAYASSITESFIAEYLLEGAWNQVANVFSDAKLQDYNDLAEMLEKNIHTCEGWCALTDKYHDLYQKQVDSKMSWYDDGADDFSDEEKTTEALSSERDIVLALDVSGSMNGTPMEETRRASVNFVETILGKGANIGVVTYATEAGKRAALSTDKKRLENVIGSLESGGETNMESGLEKARSMLNAGNAKKKIIVLMSDGEPNEGKKEDALVQYAEMIKKEGILIYTLGFFGSISDTKSSAQLLMERIASEGCHYEVESADDLVFFFEDIADQISGQKYIYVRIACPVEVAVTYDGQTLDSSEENQQLRTDFGTLAFEESDGEGETDTNGEDDDRVKILRLKEGVDYDLQVRGTGQGTMNYTIGFMDDDGNYCDFRKFENIEIKEETVIDAVVNKSAETTLNIDEDGDGSYDLFLAAGENGCGEEVKRLMWSAIVAIHAVSDIIPVAVTVGVSTSVAFAVFLIVWATVKRRKQSMGIR